MGILTNTVTAGDYKGADIKLKGLKSDKVILVHKSFLSKKELKLDKSTILDIKVISQGSMDPNYQVEITFKDGKKSLATILDITYRALMSSIY